MIYVGASDACSYIKKELISQLFFFMIFYCLN